MNFIKKLFHKHEWTIKHEFKNSRVITYIHSGREFEEVGVVQDKRCKICGKRKVQFITAEFKDDYDEDYFDSQLRKNGIEP